MATNDLDRLESAGLWTSDPTTYPQLRAEARVGENIAIAAVPMEYRTERRQFAFCYICGRRNHNHGFVAVLDDQTAVLIGNCCANSLINQTELVRARNVLARRKAAVHYEGRSAGIVNLIDQLSVLVADYGGFCEDVDDRFDQIKQEFPDQFAKLNEFVTRHGPRLMTTEVIVQSSTSRSEKRETKYAYVDKEVGTLRGTRLLLARKRLGGLQYSIGTSIASLARVTAHDATNRPEAERLVSRFRLEVQEPAALLDELAAAALTFLTVENLRTFDTWLQYERAVGGDLPLARVSSSSYFMNRIGVALKAPLRPFTPLLSTTITSGLAVS